VRSHIARRYGVTGVKRNGVVALYAVRRRIEQKHSFDRFVKILRLKQQAQITQAGSRSFQIELRNISPGAVIEQEYPARFWHLGGGPAGNRGEKVLSRNHAVT
jgi:hypothetical protein